MDGVRDGLEGDMTSLAGRVDQSNEDTLAAARSERLGALEESIRRLESELERAHAATRDAEVKARNAEAAVGTGRERLAEAERDWTARLAGLERRAGEIPGLRSQVDALRDRAGAEAARADGLDRELREVQRRLAAGESEREPATARPPTSDRTPRSSGSAASSEPETRSTGDAVRADKPDRSALMRGATRDPDELARITAGLNALLRLSPGATKYVFASVGGVSGRELLDVRVEGRDVDDRVERTIEAPFAVLTVKPGESAVLLEFKDGELVRGDLRAPFFQGRYGLVLDADTSRWKSAGLAFLTVE
jgi:hypothetical protein